MSVSTQTNTYSISKSSVSRKLEVGRNANKLFQNDQWVRNRKPAPELSVSNRSVNNIQDGSRYSEL
jgi:hypothetical protein